MISIHAPAKGATLKRICTSTGNTTNFNPRSREGSDDQRIYRKRYSMEEFQSTLPRRERRYGSSKSYNTALFQSTLPRRERPA